jgi:hypothetical protein
VNPGDDGWLVTVRASEPCGFRVLGCWAAQASAGRGRCLLTLLTLSEQESFSNY